MAERPRVLFVDDEEAFANTMATFLSSHGFEVETAFEAKNAIALAASKNYQIIVTDINMPGMDGIELIRTIREISPDQRIIVFTGFPSHESQEEAYKLGVLNYLVKPFSTERFLELLNKALTVNGEGLFGPVELTFEDLIQVYSQQLKSMVLEIQNGEETGRIHFKNGRIIHAETKTNKGTSAFYEIQSWKVGRFKTEPKVENVTETIDLSVDALILEGARLQDEESKEAPPPVTSKTQKKTEKVGKDANNSQRRSSMPSMIEEINSALKDLAENTPGLSLSLLVDNEGLPVARYSSIQIPEGTAERVAVASLAMLGLARRNTDQLGLQGFQEVLIKADTGYVYSVSVGGPAGYVLVARTDQSITLGALFMTVRTARERINKAMGITL